VTVHVVAPPAIRLAGLHASEDTTVTGVTVTVAAVLPPSVAVTVTGWDVATDPAVAVNVVEVALAGTVTEAGIGSTVGWFDASVTVAPPAGATWFKVAVHVVDAPDVMLGGEQSSEDTSSTGVTVTVAPALAPRVAVSVTV
jgi:hypothetical protein